MNRNLTAIWLLTFSGLLLSSSVFAAAPKLEYLFPAGAQRGTTVKVTAAGSFDRWPVQVHVSGKGIDIQPSKTKGELTITVARDAEPGVYWLRVHDEQGASVERPFFVGTLPEILEQEPNDDPRKPQVLTSSSVTVNGRLAKPNDVDTFAVKLTKGQTLVASLEAHQTLRSPMDGVLQVLSADGFVLARNDDYHGLDPQIVFTAPGDGTYLVRTFAFPSMADASIRFAGKDSFVYRLTLTTGPFVDHVYPVAVPRANPGSVDLIGWNLPAELRKFPIKPGSGSVLKLFDARIANPFFVRIEPHAAVTKASVMVDKSHLVSLPITITGRLDKPGSGDVYRFLAKKGERIGFRIESASLGFSLDPVLRLTDAKGKVLTEARAAALHADASFEYGFQQDALHAIEVGDLLGQAGPRHVYSLNIGSPTPGFALKLVSDNFTVTPGKTLEIPVAVTRLGSFKPDISLSVEGLPAQVSMSATAKSITLRSIGAAFSGPIRIVGTAKDGTKRFAGAPVTELGRVTESLWLTVLRK